MGNLKVDSQICLARDPYLILCQYFEAGLPSNPFEVSKGRSIEREREQNNRKITWFRIGRKQCALYYPGKVGEYKIEGRVADSRKN